MDLELFSIESYLEDVARNQWQRFVNEDLDTNALLFEAVEHLYRNEIIDGSAIEKIVEFLESEYPKPLNRIFTEMELTVKEIAEDCAEWSKAQSQGIPGILRYHGLAVGDFV